MLNGKPVNSQLNILPPWRCGSPALNTEIKQTVIDLQSKDPGQEVIYMQGRSHLEERCEACLKLKSFSTDLLALLPHKCFAHDLSKK